MFELKIENKNGILLNLTQNESNYQVVGIEGLQPPAATINLSKNANMDGSTFNSSYLNERNIVLTVKLRGEVEKNRLKLYEFLGTGDYCKIFYSNGSRQVYCEGHAESIENDMFSESQEVQISIICENPYLYALNLIYMDISKDFNVFEFPFSIEESGAELSSLELNRRASVLNLGEAPTGIEMTLHSTMHVRNPIIYNESTGDFLKLNTDLNVGEIIIINTNKGKKYIKKYVDGVEYNILNTLVGGSTWHQLKVGANAFVYTADENESTLFIEFTYGTLYKGV